MNFLNIWQYTCLSFVRINTIRAIIIYLTVFYGTFNEIRGVIFIMLKLRLLLLLLTVNYLTQSWYLWCYFGFQACKMSIQQMDK